LQAHGRFADDHNFTFYCFNVRQRHGAIHGVNAAVRSNPTAIAGFADMLRDPAFMQRLQLAATNPSSPAASTLLQQLLPLLNISEGRHVSPSCAHVCSLCRYRMVA
jgi:hypothetical protein